MFKDEGRTRRTSGTQGASYLNTEDYRLGQNDFEAIFMNRRSVRAYADRPIEDRIKEQILAAAMRAPTAGNLMLYSIVEIDDLELKKTLAQTCDHQPFIARAPWVLVFVADYARIMAWYAEQGVPELCAKQGKAMERPREADLLLACCDALIAAQTAAIAAQALGLGSCYVGDIMEQWETHRQLLSLPRYTFPITMLCFGYPTEQQRTRAQTERLPKTLIVHHNQYQVPSEDGLATMYPEAGQSLYERKFGAAFSLEMRRSVSRMLEDWK